MDITLIEATIYDNITEENGRGEVLNALRTLNARVAEAEKVIKSGQVLVSRMFEVYEDPQYQSAFSLLYDHQGRYTGKQWTKEQNDFVDRAAAFLKGE